MNGKLISIADYGNINYGYTGTSLGLAPKTLYQGAGYVQTGKVSNDASKYYGDTEVDFNNVKKGIEMANAAGYHSFLSLPVKQIFSIMGD